VSRPRIRTESTTVTCGNCERRYSYTLQLYPGERLNGALRKKGWSFAYRRRFGGRPLCPPCTRSQPR